MDNERKRQTVARAGRCILLFAWFAYFVGFGAERQARAAVPYLTFQAEFQPVAPASEGYSWYGHCVGLDIGVGVVGGPAVDGNQVGHAYAYVGGSGRWQFSQELSGSGQREEFGTSVAASGDTILVGGPGFQVAGVVTGAAYFFVLSQGAWSLQQQVIGPQDGNTHVFGSKVALDGDTALIAEEPFGTPTVYVYTRTGLTWSLQQALTAVDADNSFGQDGVAISGDTALVSDFGQANLQGAVYVFVRSAGVWQLQQEIPSPDPPPADGGLGEVFGQAVALRGDTAVVGDAVAGTHVFTRTAAIWSQQAVLPTPATALAISEDASTILVGNTLNTSQTFVSLWGWSGSSWTKQQDVLPPNPNHGWFGYSVALRGTAALVGSLHGGLPGGQAYFFGPGSVLVPAMSERTAVVLGALLLLVGAGAVKYVESVRGKSSKRLPAV